MSTKHPRQDIEVCISARDWESSSGDFQLALLHAVERDTRSRWRVVCANILAECIEPYRTLVLRREVLDSLRAQQQSSCLEISQVTAELHTPLYEDTQANIVVNPATHFASAA